MGGGSADLDNRAADTAPTERTVMPDKQYSIESAAPDNTQPRSCAGGAPANKAAGYLWCCEITGLPVESLDTKCRCRGCYGFRCAWELEQRHKYLAKCAGGTVSEAEVEAAAIAIHDGEYDATRYPWQTETIATRQGYREMARAALEAAAKVREAK